MSHVRRAPRDGDQRAAYVLLVGAALVIASGCGVSTSHTTRQHTIRVRTIPPGAEVWRVDAQGRKILGTSPGSLAVRHTIRTQSYSRLWHWGITAAFVAMAAGGIWLIGDRPEGEEIGNAEFVMALVGIPGALLGLGTGINVELNAGQAVLPQTTTIGASLPGHADVWETVTVPGADPSLILSLTPTDETPAPAKPYEPDEERGVASGQPTEDRQVIAVFDLQDQRGRLDRRSRRQLTDVLVAALAGEGRFRVVPGARIRARLAERKRRAARECADETCQLELGRTLAAHKSLDIRLLSLGDRCRVTAVLYDLKSETADRAAAVHTPCTQEALVGAMEAVARQLTDPGAAVEEEAP